MIRLKLFAITIAMVSFGAHSQVTAGDCFTAIDICSNAGFSIDPNGFGTINELGDGFSTGLVSNPATNPNIVAALGMPNAGCLMSGELNSTWMIVNIASNGSLEFSFGIDGGMNCYDWIMWPYSATTCSDVQANLVPPVACNWNGNCESFTGMAGGPNGSSMPSGGDQSNFEDAINVICGEQYLICFSNFSSALTNVPLNFFGSANISCTTYNPVSVNDTTVCEGLCVDLVAQGAITYSWVANPDLSSTIGSTVTACPPGPGVYDYYVTGTGVCGIGVDTSTVTVVALPVLDLIAPIITCDSLILPVITGLNLSGTEAYYTTSGGTGTQYLSGSMITGSVILFLYDSSGVGCSDEQTLDITIQNSPIAGSDSSLILCSTAGSLDLNTMLNGADPGGVWLETTVPASGQFNNGTGAFDPTSLVGGTYAFTYTVDGTSPCIDDVASINVIIVNGNPVLLCPSSISTSCSILDEPAYLDLNEFLGAGGSSSDPSNQLDSASFILLSELSDGNSCPETITRTYQISNSCGLIANCSQLIVVNDLILPTASNPITINVNCPVDVPAPNMSQVTDAADNCSIPVITHISDISDGNVCNNETITRTYRVTDNCGNSIDVVQSIVITASGTSVDAGSDLTVCAGEQVILSAIAPSFATLTWNNGVIDGQAFVPPVGITTYVATADMCTGLCVSTDTMTIEVIAPPNVAFMADTLSGCEPQIVRFTNLSTPAGTNCIWIFGDGNSTVGCNTVTNIYGGAGLFDVSLQVTDANGCTTIETYTDYINIYDNPTASFTPNPSQIDVNNTLVYFMNNTIGGVSYTWDFGDSTAFSFEENPEHVYPSNPGVSYPVTLYAVSEYGCTDSLIRYIIVQDVIIYYVPNAFTPDGDEFNNVFKPIFTAGYDPFDFEMLIFNRWGQVIFESHDSEAGWDGTYGARGLVEQGMYTWTIEFQETMSDKRHKISGHVSILK